MIRWGVFNLDDICEKFGLNVKKFRELKGISQEKLAEESSLHRTYISAVERGVRSISLKNIQKISKALEIDVHILFMFGDEDNK
jgi:transcriptional regulator with XRE-family HTH domain